MTDYLIIATIFIFFVTFTGCGNNNELVYIFDNSDNTAKAYFKPKDYGSNISIYSTNSKEVIGTFKRNEAGVKNFIIRKDGGDILYFTEPKMKSSIIYIYDPNQYVWGYFHGFKP
ncbi:MAG: hypothetical protein WC313_01715 [Candidatus Kapaibacterium sp.]|jgi:hypothetical protein|nr:hypothetical protein [Candidatus Kapabacteria bacterium]